MQFKRLNNMVCLIKFHYDKVGRGNLEVYKDNVLTNSFKARTGSIDISGKLCYNIDTSKQWRIQDLCVSTDEKNMFINGGDGWKCRLYVLDHDKWCYTHYLIHPCVIGTMGCIGVLLFEEANELRNILNMMINEVGNINVEITKE
jgi:hypothetical protein